MFHNKTKPLLFFVSFAFFLFHPQTVTALTPHCYPLGDPKDFHSFNFPLLLELLLKVILPFLLYLSTLPVHYLKHYFPQLLVLMIFFTIFVALPNFEKVKKIWKQAKDKQTIFIKTQKTNFLWSFLKATALHLIQLSSVLIIARFLIIKRNDGDPCFLSLDIQTLPFLLVSILIALSFSLYFVSILRDAERMTSKTKKNLILSGASAISLFFIIESIANLSHFVK